MSTAPAVQITKCPPSYRPELEFDQQKYIAPKYPVSAVFGAGGDVESPGIAWEDFKRMHTQVRRLESGKRLATPIWALDDRLLRKVVVLYMEARAGFRKPQPGTERERLARAQQRINAQCALQVETLKRLLLEHKAAAPERRAQLSGQIANIDTTLKTAANFPAIIVGVVHHFYRCGLDSVATAEAVGIRPEHCRQLLWRLRREHSRMEEWKGPHLKINVLGQLPKPVKAEQQPRRYEPARNRTIVDLAVAAELNAEGYTLDEIGELFGCHGMTVRKKLIRAGLYKAHPSGRRPGTRNRQSCE